MLATRSLTSRLMGAAAGSPIRMRAQAQSQYMSYTTTVNQARKFKVSSFARGAKQAEQQRKRFSTSQARKDDQSRAKASDLKGVMNRPEITPLFMFTGGMICLALFFGVRHLLTDKELQLDHHTKSKLQTEMKDLDFDKMAKVAEDPEGKFTESALKKEHEERDQRLENIREEKKEKANQKV